MASLRDDRWKLVQQLALLAYVHRGEESKNLYKAVVGAKVLNGLWRECTQKDTIKTYRLNRCDVPKVGDLNETWMSFFVQTPLGAGAENTYCLLHIVGENQGEAILAIAQFVKDHPYATEKQIQDEVEKQIMIFVDKIK